MEPRVGSRSSEVREAVSGFIVERFLFWSESPEVAEDQSLLEGGIVDSTGLLELVDFLERHFGIEVADDEFVPENLDTLDSLTAYVLRKTDGSE